MFVSLSKRDARLKMCPDSEPDKFLIPEIILGNTPKMVPDENVNGDYGLVINGHSLVRETVSITPLYFLLSNVLM